MKAQLINQTESRMNAAISANDHIELAKLTRELVTHADSTAETRRLILQTGLAVASRIDLAISAWDESEQHTCRPTGNIVTTHTRFPGVRPTVSADAGIEFDSKTAFGSQMSQVHNDMLGMKAASRAILNDLGIFARSTYGTSDNNNALSLDISESPIKVKFLTAVTQLFPH